MLVEVNIGVVDVVYDVVEVSVVGVDVAVVEVVGNSVAEVEPAFAFL